MSLGTLLLIILVLVLFGVFPGTNRYSTGFGYAPVSIVGVIVIVLIILLLMGRL